MPPVVAQQAEIRLGDEVLVRCRATARGPRSTGQKSLGERVVEVHAGDRLHDAAVAVTQPLAVHCLHAADVRAAVLRDRDARVAIDRARHLGGPQQLVAEVLVDELVQVEQVLQQLPGRAESRRDQLDQRFGIIGGDVLVRERRAEARGMRRLRDGPSGVRAATLFDPLEPALQDAGAAGVDHAGETALEGSVDGH